MRRKVLAGFLCAALLQANAAHADAFDDANQALQDGDIEGGIASMNALAEAGDAPTQYRIGVALINFSSADGIRWMEMAADRNYAEAQRELGMLYANGIGVSKDLPRAFLWLYLAEKGAPDKASRSDIRNALKQVYAEMSQRERYNAEQLLRYWQPKL